MLTGLVLRLQPLHSRIQQDLNQIVSLYYCCYFSLSHSSSLPTPSQPVTAKQHNIQQATTTVHMPPFSTNTFLPDSISEFEHLPPYPNASSDISSSSSPSQFSDSRFTPTPIDYHYHSFHSTSPGGRLDPHLGYPGMYNEDRIKISSTASIPTNDTEGSIEIGETLLIVQ